MIGPWNSLVLRAERVDSIVNGEDFSWVLMIVIDDGLPRQLRDTHNAVGMIHTIFLDAVHGRVDMTAGAVPVGSMHMDAQWLSTHLLGIDSGRIGKPVVGMDDIEVLGARYLACNDAVVVDLVSQIARIASGKLHAA